MTRCGEIRVVQVAEEMARIAGGVPAVVRQLSEHLALNGVPVQIVHATGQVGDLPAGVEVFSYPPTGPGRPWFLGRGLRAGITGLVGASSGDQPVVHLHGVWSAPQYFAARAAHQAGAPFVFTAHGMLDPWLWDQQGWKVRAKKRAYWALMGFPALSRASVVHAITALEKRHLAELLPDARIEVIPNAIDVSDAEHCPQVERTRSILFVGRIEPKKGVDLLLRAFSAADIGREWAVDVVGPSWSAAYLSELKAIVTECKLGQRVRFHGALFGEEKQKLLDSAWVLATPSHSEAVGLVNLEAAVRCLPTITTPQTGLQDWELGGGLLVEPNVDELGRALEAACCWGEQEQRERGLASRRLVEERYSWKAVMPMWTELYSSL